jgi:hypothetical protein
MLCARCQGFDVHFPTLYTVCEAHSITLSASSRSRASHPASPLTEYG